MKQKSTVRMIETSEKLGFDFHPKRRAGNIGAVQCISMMNLSSSQGASSLVDCISAMLLVAADIVTWDEMVGMQASGSVSVSRTLVELSLYLSTTRNLYSSPHLNSFFSFLRPSSSEIERDREKETRSSFPSDLS